MAVIHFVECDYGKLGRAFVERSSEHADKESLLRDLKAGEFETPIARILAVDIEGKEGFASDVTGDFGNALFAHFNYVSCPFRDAPKVAQDLMRRAGHDIDFYDDENDACDAAFAAECARRTGEDLATFRLYGEVA